MSKQTTETLANGIKLTIAHDWIRLDLGNNRGLTTSFGSTKATGKVPVEVFRAWVKAGEPGQGIMDRIREFALTTLPTLWPDWGKAPDVSRLQIGARLSITFGKRTKYAEIKALPKRAGQCYTIQCDGELVRVAADMLDSVGPVPAEPAFNSPAAVVPGGGDDPGEALASSIPG